MKGDKLADATGSFIKLKILMSIRFNVNTVHQTNDQTET